MATAVVVVPVATVVWFGWLEPPRLAYSKEIRQSEAIIAKVESFKSKYGRLPKENEVVQTEGRFFYAPTQDGYEVGFGTGVGESESFNSKTGRWSFDR